MSGDSVRDWYARQALQQLNWYGADLSGADRRAVFADLLLGLHKQAGSLQGAIHRGYHVLKEPRDDKAAIAHEVIDVLKYALAVAVTAGVDPDELVETFWRISDAVDDRWKGERTKLEGERVLALDLDGVVADWLGGFRRWYATQREGELEPFQERDLKAPWMEPIKQRFYAEGGFRMLEPLPGAVESIRDAKARGVKVVFITARPKRRHRNVETDTIAWLRERRIPYDLLVFDRDKASALCEYVLPATILAFVEDRHKHAIEVAALGVPVLLMPSEVDGELVGDWDGITIVRSWPEIGQQLRRN